MKTLDPALQAHLDEGTTTLAWCWRITRADGVTFGFTDHDRTLSFDGTDFEPESGLTASEVRSGSDLSVDAQDAEGVLTSDRITETDILDGRWDNAEVEVWRVNWADTGQRVLMRRGAIGQIRRGRLAFVAEVRSLAHVLGHHHGRGQGGQRYRGVRGTRLRERQQIEVAEHAVEEFGLLLRVPVQGLEVDAAVLADEVGEVVEGRGGGVRVHGLQTVEPDREDVLRRTGGQQAQVLPDRHGAFGVVLRLLALRVLDVEEPRVDVARPPAAPASRLDVPWAVVVSRGRPHRDTSGRCQVRPRQAVEAATADGRSGRGRGARMRTKLIIASTAGVLTVGGLGLAVPALADTGNPAGSAVDSITEALSGLVSEGSITQEQADEVAGALDEAGIGPRGDGDGRPGDGADDEAPETPAD